MADLDAQLEAAQKRAADAMERVKDLQAKKALATARAIASLTKGERAADTKRKIIVGAVVLGLMDSDPALRTRIERELRAKARPADLELLGIKPEAAPSPAIPDFGFKP